MTWSFVEKALEDAARAGAFDRLGPAGPIDLEINPYVPEDWRLGFKLLKDHGIVPEFVQRRKEIEAIRAELAAAPRGQPAVYRAILDRLNETIEALNRSLVRENQFVRGSLQLPAVDVESELRTYLA
jgi:hypothetical protein